MSLANFFKRIINKATLGSEQSDNTSTPDVTPSQPEPKPLSDRQKATQLAKHLRSAVDAHCGGDTKDWCIPSARVAHAIHPEGEIWHGRYDHNDGQWHDIFKAHNHFIDVTADQFGGPRLLVTKELPEEYRDFDPPQNPYAYDPSDLKRLTKTEKSMYDHVLSKMNRPRQKSLHRFLTKATLGSSDDSTDVTPETQALRKQTKQGYAPGFIDTVKLAQSAQKRGNKQDALAHMGDARKLAIEHGHKSGLFAARDPKHIADYLERHKIAHPGTLEAMRRYGTDTEPDVGFDLMTHPTEHTVAAVPVKHDKAEEHDKRKVDVENAVPMKDKGKFSFVYGPNGVSTVFHNADTRDSSTYSYDNKNLKYHDPFYLTGHIDGSVLRSGEKSVHNTNGLSYFLGHFYNHSVLQTHPDGLSYVRDRELKAHKKRTPLWSRDNLTLESHPIHNTPYHYTDESSQEQAKKDAHAHAVRLAWPESVSHLWENLPMYSHSAIVKRQEQENKSYRRGYQPFSAFIIKARAKWNAELHPRDDGGRFVSKEAITAASRSPKKAEQLRAKVTDPDQRKKLDAAIEAHGKGDTSVGTKKHVDAAHRLAEKIHGKGTSATREELEAFQESLQHKDFTKDDLHELADRLGVRASGTKDTVRGKVAERGVARDRSDLRKFAGKKVSVADAKAKLQAAVESGELDTLQGRQKLQDMLTGMSRADVRALAKDMGVKVSGSKDIMASQVAKRTGKKVEAADSQVPDVAMPSAKDEPEYQYPDGALFEGGDSENKQLDKLEQLAIREGILPQEGKYKRGDDDFRKQQLYDAMEDHIDSLPENFMGDVDLDHLPRSLQEFHKQTTQEIEDAENAEWERESAIREEKKKADALTAKEKADKKLAEDAEFSAKHQVKVDAAHQHINDNFDAILDHFASDEDMTPHERSKFDAMVRNMYDERHGQSWSSSGGYDSQRHNRHINNISEKAEKTINAKKPNPERLKEAKLTSSAVGAVRELLAHKERGDIFDDHTIGDDSGTPELAMPSALTDDQADAMDKDRAMSDLHSTGKQRRLHEQDLSESQYERVADHEAHLANMGQWSEDKPYSQPARDAVERADVRLSDAQARLEQSIPSRTRMMGDDVPEVEMPSTGEEKEHVSKPWSVSSEEFAFMQGAPKPAIDLLSDSSAQQRSTMSDRQRNDMLKDRSKQRRDDRKKYNTAVSEWQDSVIDAIASNKVQLSDINDTEAAELVMLAAGELGFDVPSPFRMRQMDDAKRQKVLSDLQDFVASNTDKIKLAAKPKEPWQLTKKQHWDERFPGTPYGMSLGVKYMHLIDDQINAHKAAVERALAEGKPVPPEVLADYPDLAKQSNKPDTSIPEVPMPSAAATQDLTAEQQESIKWHEQDLAKAEKWLVEKPSSMMAQQSVQRAKKKLEEVKATIHTRFAEQPKPADKPKPQQSGLPRSAFANDEFGDAAYGMQSGKVDSIPEVAMPQSSTITANAVDSNRERGNNPGVGTQSESPKPGDGKMLKTELPKLRGSQKQVDWASSIRANMLEKLDSVAPEELGVAGQKQLAELKDFLATPHKWVGDASWWIDRKGSTTPKLIRDIENAHGDVDWFDLAKNIETALYNQLQAKRSQGAS